MTPLATALRRPLLHLVDAARHQAGVLGVVLLFLLGCALLAQQHTLLWQRLPAQTVDRFVADQVDSPLPRLPAVQELTLACAQPLSRSTEWRRAWLREELAACLSSPTTLASGDAARRAVTHYEAMIATQAQAAEDWLKAFEAQSDAHQTRMVEELHTLQRAPERGLTPLAAIGRVLTLTRESTEPRQPVGRVVPINYAATALRERMQATRARTEALAGRPLPERLKGLALLATGQQLVTDFGTTPPSVHLATDRNALADALEWQRKARGFTARGFSLSALHALPGALLLSTGLLLAVVWRTSRASWLALALWAGAGLLLSVGAVMLTDVALTGDPALRYLPERQFLHFGQGDSTLSLMLRSPSSTHQPLLWWPLLLVALALGAVSRLGRGQSFWLAPVRGWINWSAHGRTGVGSTLILVGAGLAAVFFLGMPAAVSELLILLGCIGLATYLARQAPHANAGGNLQTYNLLIVVGALLTAVGGAALRGDLGHALVSLLLAGAFVWLFGGIWLRRLIASAALVLASSLGACLMAGELVGPLSWLTEMLPPHAQDRLHAQFDPFHAPVSDLARIRWLIESSGASGWGPGYVPWQGIAAAGGQDGLPLQGPSDYVLALVSALWGRLGGLALMGLVLTLFGLSGATALRTALRPAMPPAVRWLAALGGFGCLIMAFKVVLSVGGVSGVLPLTGLPVSLIGYGPVTHLAALLYLVLALGTRHVRPEDLSRGVDVEDAHPVGQVRQRALQLAMVGLMGLGLLMFMGERHLRAGVQGVRHVAQTRFELAQVLTQAMVPAAQAADAGSAAPCPELGNAVAAWNVRLTSLAQPVRVAVAGQTMVATSSLRFDLSRLLNHHPVEGGPACSRLARTLGQMLDSDLSRLVGRQTTITAGRPLPFGDDTKRLSAFELPQSLGVRPMDYSTTNAWWGRPGCLLPATALTSGARNCPSFDSSSSSGQPSDLGLLQGLSDAWLQRNLVPQIHVALQQPSTREKVNERPVSIGPALGLTVGGTPWQPLAQKVVDCFTGRLYGTDCLEVMPRDTGWRDRHFNTPGHMRAGAIGLVLSEVDSGRIVALAGSVSDCSLDQLRRLAQPGAQGQLPALRANQRCAQLPDQRSAWLALQHPALWMVPPGSSLKELALVAGIDAGLVTRAEDDYWKRILAESHERLPVQRIALAAGPSYLDVLGRMGYATPSMELMWGQSQEKAQPAAPGQGAWQVEAFAGMDGLRATSMSLEEAERIRQEKLNGVNVDARYGHAVMTEFVAARKLADAALGGGDIRVNALGLVNLWRGLDLRHRGQTQAPELHLVEHPGHTTPVRLFDWSSQMAATRVIHMTSGVTASAWRGTAQGSCRVVFGRCPAEGLKDVSGKTGSSDFLSQENGPLVKSGAQMPAKLFGGVFTAADGKRYAVAVMALRVREGDSQTLELAASAPAEAALTLMREMGVDNGF